MIPQTYCPEVNDYVKWKKHITGWVYFKCSDYITIEVSVRPKDKTNYQHCSLHRNERLLVICYQNQWEELKYVRKRESKYEKEENSIPTCC